MVLPPENPSRAYLRKEKPLSPLTGLTRRGFAQLFRATGVLVAALQVVLLPTARGTGAWIAVVTLLIEAVAVIASTAYLRSTRPRRPARYAGRR